MEPKSENLIAVEDLLIAVEISHSSELIVVQGEAVVDLAELNLTPQELQKFDKILKRINARLAESFQKEFPTSSVISEIRRRPSTF